MKKLHLICNAHIDPMWQWELSEGIGSVLSTFSVAADICESNEAFVFNHNEAYIYKFVEEYEPLLFTRIQKLVEQKKWHIMGGWYLQPDCNIPSGESFVRQIEVGQNYFKEKFGVVSTTAINFDPFGHTKGLVQILDKAGYDSYIICRPQESELDIKDELFIWKGFNDSSVCVQRMASYNSAIGKVDEKIKARLVEKADDDISVLLWGVGNHGGGPSRKDMELIEGLNSETDVELVHSTPEAYFSEVTGNELKEYDRSLQHTMRGCYTSQVRIKQKHKELENAVKIAEMMCSQASDNGLMDYPYHKLDEIWHNLLVCQFHDILPGSSIQEVESQGIAFLDKGLQDALSLQTEAFYQLNTNNYIPEDDELPIIVYNPHPYQIETLIDCEMMLPDQNHEPVFIDFEIYDGEVRVDNQVEKERSNVPIQWRKRVLFAAEVGPMQSKLYRAKMIVKAEKPSIDQHRIGDEIVISNPESRVIFGSDGLIKSYMVDGYEYAEGNFGRLIALTDTEDSWGMDDNYEFIKKGSFTLVSAEFATEIVGCREKIAPMRVIEDGPIRSVVEGIYAYNRSFAVVKYMLPKKSGEITINIKLFNMEHRTMMKIELPTALTDAIYKGKTAFGIDELDRDGKEVVAHDYVYAEQAERVMVVINKGTYGSSFFKGTISPTLLRSAAYCAHPLGDKVILPQDRYMPHMDIGERDFCFTIVAGEKILEDIGKTNEFVQNSPLAVCYYPLNKVRNAKGIFSVDNPNIVISSIYKKAGIKGTIYRIYNAVESVEKVTLCFGVENEQLVDSFKPFEVKTYLYDRNKLKEVPLIMHNP
jgi:alpha-mannosidase